MRHHPIYSKFKPVGWEISVYAPLHDWRAVYAPGWGASMKRNLIGRSLTTLLFHTQAVGLCGKISSPIHSRGSGS